MVAAEHKPGKRCSYMDGGCDKIAWWAIRAFGTRTWKYACGYHNNRVIDEQMPADGRVDVEALR